MLINVNEKRFAVCNCDDDGKLSILFYCDDIEVGYWQKQGYQIRPAKSLTK